jgi:hypothetical protein
MTGAARRWTGRLGGLAQRLLVYVSPAGSGLWLIPPCSDDQSPGDRPGVTDEQPAPAVDLRELDDWLERVRSDAGTHD